MYKTCTKEGHSRWRSGSTGGNMNHNHGKIRYVILKSLEITFTSAEEVLNMTKKNHCCSCLAHYRIRYNDNKDITQNQIGAHHMID